MENEPTPTSTWSSTTLVPVNKQPRLKRFQAFNRSIRDNIYKPFVTAKPFVVPCQILIYVSVFLWSWSKQLALFETQHNPISNLGDVSFVLFFFSVSVMASPIVAVVRTTNLVCKFIARKTRDLYEKMTDFLFGE